MSNVKLFKGDCLEVMQSIADKSVDMILCDLPYETTANKWDKIIDFDMLWAQYSRVIKDDGVIVLFATQPFTTRVIGSNMELYRYSWIWKKDTPTGFLNCNYAPLKFTEDICVFSKAKVGSLSKDSIRYYPQGVTQVSKLKQNKPNSKFRASQGYSVGGNSLNSDTEYTQEFANYPTNILEFARDKDAIHPTQKPIDLLCYLIQTYTREGELVLDNCMGSGSTGVASVYTGRDFIGIELNDTYFEGATERIDRAKQEVAGMAVPTWKMAKENEDVPIEDWFKVGKK